MKYIKTYESYDITFEDYLEIWKDVIDKKYILYWNDTYKEYCIQKVDYNKLDYIKNNYESFKESPGYDRATWIIAKRLPYIPIYTYKDKLIRNRKSKYQYAMRPNDKNNILYRSDDLNDVKSNLPVFINMRKFNL